MNSCLYVGSVNHTRLHPFEHHFNYSLFMAYLDLAELDEVFHSIKGWALNRAALVSFMRKEHLGDETQSLDHSVRKLIEQSTGKQATGPIRLLTHLRYFGHCFNPVSFYYCFDERGDTAHTVVAEVNNIPWHQQHCYVMPVNDLHPQGRVMLETEKAFHVSPFLPMDLSYRFLLSVPEEKLSVNIDVQKVSQSVFNASMQLSRVPLTQFNAWKSIARFPAMTMQVVFGIYWQALRLKLKGATYYPHTINS